MQTFVRIQRATAKIHAITKFLFAYVHCSIFRLYTSSPFGLVVPLGRRAQYTMVSAPMKEQKSTT